MRFSLQSQCMEPSLDEESYDRHMLSHAAQACDASSSDKHTRASHNARIS